LQVLALNHPGTYEGVQVQVVSRYQKDQLKGGEGFDRKDLVARL
jgi:hypothetical protein